MRKQSDLSTRNREILHAIIREYISTGEPVASRTIARRRPESVSPATVRNVMADLADEGYLEQPHTSAGRIPTAKAFQQYVQSLAPRSIPATDLERLRNQISSTNSTMERVEQTCHILTGLTRSLSIAAAIPALNCTLKRIELLLVDTRRVLFVVVTDDHTVHNKVVELLDRTTQEELDSVRNYVNHHFAGMTLLAARRELERTLAEERSLYDQLLQRLGMFHRLGLLDIDVGPEVFTEGASYLLAMDFHLMREKLQHLLQALEEKKRVLMLLDSFLAMSRDGIAVQVGLDDIHPTLGDFSLIGTNVKMRDGGETRIAVLGPLRMDYERVIAAVRRVSAAVTA